MATFCIQIQPDRAPDMDLNHVQNLCRQVASDKALVMRHGVVTGDDGGPYLNLMFEVFKPVDFWDVFKEMIYGDSNVGSAMNESSMATCTYDPSWDDYLLLYHYDRKFALDDLQRS